MKTHRPGWRSTVMNRGMAQGRMPASIQKKLKRPLGRADPLFVIASTAVRAHQPRDDELVLDGPWKRRDGLR